MNAYRLYQRDPKQPRGLILAAWYVGMGIGKTSLGSIITVGLFVIVMLIFAVLKIQAAPMNELEILSITVGILLVFPLCLYVQVLGWWTYFKNVRVWLDSSVFKSLDNEQWPPRGKGLNSAGQAYLICSITNILLLSILIVLIAANPMEANKLLMLIPLGGLLAAIFITLPLVCHRITARDPADCWK